MKVAVLGAGVIGITSAWYLARAGHEVVVIDRQEEPALETSFANAGEVSFGYCSPWAAPGIPRKAVKWLMIRVGGMAEISGFTNDRPDRRRRTLEHCVSDLFPGGDLAKAIFWSGLRPMTPDGTPVIGPTGVKGLFLNTGHGTLGWTMSCGSAKLLADLVSNRAPDIDAQDLTVPRYAA